MTWPIALPYTTPDGLRVFYRESLDPYALHNTDAPAIHAGILYEREDTNYIVTAEASTSATYAMLTTNDIITIPDPGSYAGMLIEVGFTINVNSTGGSTNGMVDLFVDDVASVTALGTTLEFTDTSNTEKQIGGLWQFPNGVALLSAVGSKITLAAGATHTIKLKFKKNLATSITTQKRRMWAKWRIRS